MHRLLTTLVALAFAAQALFGPACACATGGEAEAMAPDHSCCASGDHQPAARQNAAGEQEAGAREQEQRGCQCATALVVFSDEEATQRASDSRLLAMPVAAPAWNVSVAVLAAPAANPPPQWPPPGVQLRLARLQSWLC